MGQHCRQEEADKYADSQCQQKALPAKARIVRAGIIEHQVRIQRSKTGGKEHRMNVVTETVFFDKAVKSHAEKAEPDIQHMDAPGRETNGQNHGKNGHAVDFCLWKETQRRADQAHTADIQEGACIAAVAGRKIVRRRFGRKAQ